MRPNEILREYFGYDEFREGQAEIIEALALGKDAFGVMPTGAGKSLCYQIPALLLRGVTLVITPLISLMRDQVLALCAHGIPAAFINSSLSEAQLSRAAANARAGQYKLIYVAPERLLSPAMTELANHLEISLIAVDEAHCISQWGQDFRPSYMDIPRFVDALPSRPAMAAFTATATPRVRADILETLALKSPIVKITGFDRPNLYFEVQSPKDKYAALIGCLKENESGIVYCSTRKEVESVAQRLQKDGYSAARYHAGLPDEERSAAQDDFLYDRVKLIVATNAFGMGIDKSNVRFVIHYNMPQNVESYYQEAGRAGRDGVSADCILFYARKDINTALYLINQSANSEEIARNKQLLNQMERYCESDGCLRRYMLNYFGEATEEDCGNCGNCTGKFDETDVTQDAQKVLSHIARLNKLGKRFMFTHTASILLGKSDDYQDLPTFGLMKGVQRPYIRRLINRLTALGYIKDDGYLSVMPLASDVLFNGANVTLRGLVSQAARRKDAQGPIYAVSDALLMKLKELRMEIARGESVPAFVVFSDATLVDMCAKLPKSDEEMLRVSGVGKVKLERYGGRFLELLREEADSGGAPERAFEAPELTEDLLLAQVETEEAGLQISRVADNINAVLLRCGKPKTSGMKLNAALVEAGYLVVQEGVKLPTGRGRELGIITIMRHSSRGSYIQCLFGERAQRLCAELAAGELGLRRC